MHISMENLFQKLSAKMFGHIPEDIHIRHCMLYEFHKGSKATKATEIICGVYGDVQSIGCQQMRALVL